MALKKLGAAAVIVNAVGEVLLVKHTYGHLNWELPGGHAEGDESIVPTVVREVYEETGLRVSAQHTTGIYYDSASDMHHFVFTCRLVDPLPLPQPSDSEISMCAFWPIGALPRPISTFTVRRITDALHPNEQPLPCTIAPLLWLE